MKLTEMRKNKLQNSIQLGQVSHRDLGKRATRHTRNEGRAERGHQRSYKSVQKIVVICKLGEISVEKWQRERNQTTNGEITKQHSR